MESTEEKKTFLGNAFKNFMIFYAIFFVQGLHTERINRIAPHFPGWNADYCANIAGRKYSYIKIIPSCLIIILEQVGIIEIIPSRLIIILEEGGIIEIIPSCFKVILSGIIEIISTFVYINQTEKMW